MDTPTVPDDMWVCGNCHNGNLIEMAASVCPTCSHIRDYGIGCCANPGEPTWSTGLLEDEHESQGRYCDEPFVGYDVSNSTMSPSAHGCEDAAAFELHMKNFNDANICNWGNAEYHNEFVECSYEAPNGSYPIPNAFGPAPGVWTCDECGSSNSAVHGDQCGACGSMRQ